MRSQTFLSDMKRGELCRILKISLPKEMKRRLQDFGIICGTEMECLMKSPLGDPTAFLVKGTVIALRSDETKLIEVEVL